MWHFIKQFQICFILARLEPPNPHHPPILMYIGSVTDEQHLLSMCCIILESDRIAWHYNGELVKNQSLFSRTPFSEEQTNILTDPVACPCFLFMSFFLYREHTLSMCIHTAIIWLYISVIMAEVIIFCRRQQCSWLLLWCYAFVVLSFCLPIIKLFLYIKEACETAVFHSVK